MFAESAPKQSSPSRPLHPPSTSAVPITLPKAPNASTHVYLQQFARERSSDFSLSPQRPLQIVEAYASLEFLSAARSERTSCLRVQSPILPGGASSTE